MALVASASKGMLRELPSYPVKKRIVKMVATNSLGWEVQQYSSDGGWSRVSPIVKTEGLAELLKEELQNSNPEQSFRVYESLDFPIRG